MTQSASEAHGCEGFLCLRKMALLMGDDDLQSLVQPEYPQRVGWGGNDGIGRCVRLDVGNLLLQGVSDSLRPLHFKPRSMLYDRLRESFVLR
jgi:hypothetical protein